MQTESLKFTEPNFLDPAMELPPGRYRHFKGREYTVLGLARHSETQEEFVVYRQEYGDRALWVRPKAMFLETVEADGQRVARFEFLRPCDAAEA